MPIYEYRCEGCGSHIEVARKISDPPLVKCQSCSGRLVKLISNTSFVLKGGGWYADGYGSSKPSSTPSESPSPSKDSGSAAPAASPSASPAATPSAASSPAPASGSTGSSGGDSKAA